MDRIRIVYLAVILFNCQSEADGHSYDCYHWSNWSPCYGHFPEGTRLMNAFCTRLSRGGYLLGSWENRRETCSTGKPCPLGSNFLTLTDPGELEVSQQISIDCQLINRRLMPFSKITLMIDGRTIISPYTPTLDDDGKDLSCTGSIAGCTETKSVTLSVVDPNRCYVAGNLCGMEHEPNSGVGGMYTPTGQRFLVPDSISPSEEWAVLVNFYGLSADADCLWLSFILNPIRSDVEVYINIYDVGVPLAAKSPGNLVNPIAGTLFEKSFTTTGQGQLIRMEIYGTSLGFNFVMENINIENKPC